MHLDDRELGQLERASDQIASLPIEQSQLLLDVLNTINDRVYVKDSLGRIVLVNSAFLHAYGLTESVALGHYLDDFLPAEMVRACTAADQKVQETAEAASLVVQFQHPVTGEDQWIETHKLPMLDANERVVGVVGVSRDITARRKAEEELKHQTALLERIIETVPDEIFVKDRSRRIILANRGFYTRHNVTKEEALGNDPDEYLAPDLHNLSLESDRSVLFEGKSIRMEFPSVGEDGEIQHLEICKLPLIENGAIVGVVGICRDLTESKAADQRSKQNEALLLHAARLSSLGELAAVIAHEVNQPLFSIRNYAKAVENTLKQEEQPDLDAITRWISQIHKEADRGGKITQRLKSFATATDIRREISSINRIALESIDFLRIEAQKAEVVVETQLSDCLPEIAVDRIQIQQVLVNLLKNALEACSEKQTADASVIVSTQVTSSGIEVCVADNGPGLSSESDANILDPFQTTKHEGVGLGLAICNTIIQDHQGKLDYETNDLGGMTFRFELPIPE